MLKTKIHSLRLGPGQDLKLTLLKFAAEQQFLAATILSCVGSLSAIQLRMAGGKKSVSFPGPQEIVSFVGTFSKQGGHFHISLSDDSGQVKGGHLLEGNLIYTTAEVVILEMLDREFVREVDPLTGYLELKVNELNVLQGKP